MPMPDNARSGHALLRIVLITLAIGVLLISALMWWWVREAESSGAIARAEVARMHRATALTHKPHSAWLSVASN
ncbi:hypothetical protein [Dyella silvae]|uniref:hypothetical protein n=1 Tax=Dyella silvae TaxID=2994424 RepID=UPI00226552EA|nr:hypothetical protein [Dyella silvae]